MDLTWIQNSRIRNIGHISRRAEDFCLTPKGMSSVVAILKIRFQILFIGDCLIFLLESG